MLFRQVRCNFYGQRANHSIDFRINRAASAIGTPEPIYGPEAIQTVVQQAEETPYTELKKDDLRWKLQDGTNVETRTFYDVLDDGRIIMSQLIYSNVA